MPLVGLLLQQPQRQHFKKDSPDWVTEQSPSIAHNYNYLFPTSHTCCFWTITTRFLAPVLPHAQVLSSQRGSWRVHPGLCQQKAWHNLLPQSLAEAVFSRAGGLRCCLCIVVSRHLWLVPNSWCWHKGSCFAGLQSLCYRKSRQQVGNQIADN